MEFVNLKKQYKTYKQEINNAIVKVLQKGKFILGEEVEKFEQEFKKYTETKYAISCASGTDALSLALRASDIGNKNEVIVPSFTFIAPASAVVLAGAKPVFADIEATSFNLNADDVLKKITKKTKAIIVVHMFGYPANIVNLKKICKAYNLILIEDCAQAFGAKYKEKHVGTFGDFGCFSFFPTKNIGAYGDGGMVITNDKNKYAKLRALRFHGRTKKYYSKFIGFNSRLDTIQAAILSVKLKYFNKELNNKLSRAKYYSDNLDCPLIISKPSSKKNYLHTFNSYTLKLSKRNLVQKYLQSKNIPTSIYYPYPLHTQEAFEYLDYKKGDLPVSEQICKEVLSLPISGFITIKEQNHTIEALNNYV